MRALQFFALASIFFFTACNSDDPEPSKVDLNLSFYHLVDGDLVTLDQMIYKNALDQDFSIKTIKYFISELTLYPKNDNPIKFDDIFYVDVRTMESLNQVLSERVPVGEYTGISFVHGLAPAENTSNRFTNPPESLMEWPEPMGGGYHYMKLEGEYRAGTEESFFNFHAGGLNGTAYEIHLDLSDLDFTISEEQHNLGLKMEIKNWFTNPTNWDFSYFGSAIMGNAEAQQTIKENGKDVYTFTVTGNN